MFHEYCNDENLKQYLRKKGTYLSEQEVLAFFRHIIEGYKELFKFKIIHRDINP